MNYCSQKTRSSSSGLWTALFILSFSFISFLWRFPSRLAELDHKTVYWIWFTMNIFFLFFFIFLTIHQSYNRMVKMNYFAWLSQFYCGRSEMKKDNVSKPFILTIPNWRSVWKTNPQRKSIYLISCLSSHKIFSSWHKTENAEGS